MAWVLGLFVTDGHVNNTMHVITSGSQDIAVGLLAVFDSWGIRTVITTNVNQVGNPIYRVWVKGKLELPKPAKIIYNDAKLDDFHVYKRVYMTQHSDCPYYSSDDRDCPRWQWLEGKLVHIGISSRTSFRTSISKLILDTLKKLADENDTRINYLFENGLKNLLAQEVILYDQDTRPKDRIQYNTTYDHELLASVKDFAKKNKLLNIVCSLLISINLVKGG